MIEIEQTDPSSRVNKITGHLPLIFLILVVSLGCIITNFLTAVLSRNLEIQKVADQPTMILVGVMALFISLLAASIALTIRFGLQRIPWLRSLLTLFPFAFLIIWPAAESSLSPWIPIAIAVLGSLIIFRDLDSEKSGQGTSGRKTLAAAGLGAALIAYFRILRVDGSEQVTQLMRQVPSQPSTVLWH